MNSESESAGDARTVEMPQSTIGPFVLAVGLVLLAMGAATSIAFLPLGAVVFIVGLGLWIASLLPGRGHAREPLVEPELRPEPVQPAAEEVERLQTGMPGYRLRLPVKYHPVSAGVKGGLIGGLVMPVPALIYGWLSGHGIWWPINLLSGMIVPGVGTMSTEELEQFHPMLLVWGIVIHVVISLVLGLSYGVLMPTLPKIRKPIAWGALLMPLLWTAVSYVALGQMNPEVRAGIEWPWFVVSQLVFGIVAAVVFSALEIHGSIRAGLIGGVIGGLLMPIPAVLWSLWAGHGIWYPANLLAALATHFEAPPTTAELELFHSNWLITAIVIHLVLSLSFGLAFALVLPRVPTIPGPFAWGGLLMPLLWTAISYGLMGVVNPVLQQRVDWPWFVVSQFVFGIVAAIVVVLSEEVYVEPAGKGREQLT
jgi:hypothetical protein